MYYDYSERVTTLASHRIMAIDRGEKEKVLAVSIEFDKGISLTGPIAGLRKNARVRVWNISRLCRTAWAACLSCGGA